jgi:hypothetical protein
MGFEIYPVYTVADARIGNLIHMLEDHMLHHEK